jgi:DNA-binding IclR family transcriptional regulator
MAGIFVMASRRALTRRLRTSSRAVRYAAPALEKGLEVLELLASRSQALTHSEIARQLGRTVSEVFRMLVCLEERGYISRSGPSEQYRLTLKMFEMVHRYHPLERLIAEARPLIEQVANRTRQSCHLAMMNNAEVVVVAQVDAPGNMGFSMRLGAHIDILNTASGQVILAFQSEDVRARALEIWRGRSNKPIPPGLNRHLREIRRRGYEELRSYQVDGVVNISYPVLNQHGQAIAAMAVPFLAHIRDGIGRSRVKEVLASASQVLSAAMGNGKRRELSTGQLEP